MRFGARVRLQQEIVHGTDCIEGMLLRMGSRLAPTVTPGQIRLCLAFLTYCTYVERGSIVRRLFALASSLLSPNHSAAIFGYMIYLHLV